MAFIRALLLSLSLLIAAPALAAGDSGWLYKGSDIAPDPAWRFGTLPNGVRYAVRRNAMPPGQVSLRVRIDAGSLNEADNERGWAHFVEHMAFRANAAFADTEARHALEKLGVSFGSDSNASTAPTQTVYQLDLPNADDAKLDLGMHYLSQALDTAKFESVAVEAERKIVLEEKGRRPELSVRMMETSWPLFFAGLKLAERDPIGTPATLAGATPEGLRAFYERWYRPERATVIVVGDADPAKMEALIARHFGGWQGSGPAPREPDYGAIAAPPTRAATLAYPEAPYSASVLWLRPYAEGPDTVARERDDLARTIATRILNRRMEAKARGEGAAFVAAGVNEQKQIRVADTTGLSINPRAGKWREALAESFSFVADARAAPPSAAEIARELSNIRTSATSAVEGETTVGSAQRAQQLITAIDGNSVVSSAAYSLKMLDDFAPQMTPAAVHAAMKQLFGGAPPRIVLLAPDVVAPNALESALATAEKAAPATRVADRSISFANLPALGAPGREVSRERIEDMGVTIVRFANGSTLTFKQTDYEKGSVSVALRFGSGIAGLSPQQKPFQSLANIVGSSGLADLDLDALERLLTGRKIALSFGVTEDAFVYRGATNGSDLADQMRLLATKIAFPRWDAPLFARVKTNALQTYDLYKSSATARAGRELGAVTRPGDKRWMPLEKAELAATDLPALQGFFDPLLASGPIEAIIVGDVDLESAVAAMKTSIAALPARAPVRDAAGSRAVEPPVPNPTPVTFTHDGDKDQAFALIGWSTFGGKDRIKERRALSLAANMFQVRLFERFRETEGSSYSPNAASSTSTEFADWGVFYAASELRPENVESFFRAAREILADLAAKPAEADEFERASNPVKSGIERRVKTNAYWLDALEDWTTDPRAIAQTRSYYADYAGLTPEDVRVAVANYVADAGDWSMLVLPAKASGGAR